MQTVSTSRGSVLTINGGSSSIKFAIFDRETGEPRRRMSGQIDRIGLPDAVLRTRRPPAGEQSQPIAAADPASAAHALSDWLQKQSDVGTLGAVVHRIVHGGPKLFEPQKVTSQVLHELHEVAAIDPVHLPGEIALIEVFSERYPGLPQIVCFDTAFHRDLPNVARILPIPRRYEQAGLRRYGFHGLSYEYLLKQLAREAGDAAARGRVILAHLGSGASVAAVKDGKSIDTTMSFTPTAGLVMGTRCGDLDPGVLVYLMRNENKSADEIDDLVNRQSGLKGISQTSSDLRDLMAVRGSDARAADAIDIFCYQARKHIGAMSAALGGLDTLVFSGGIGEHQAEIREQICNALKFLGIELDSTANAANASVISKHGSAVGVRVIATDEEVTLAIAAFELLDRA
jgi:acetate kinase